MAFMNSKREREERDRRSSWIPRAPGAVGPTCREGWGQVNSGVGPTPAGAVHVGARKRIPPTPRDHIPE